MEERKPTEEFPQEDKTGTVWGRTGDAFIPGCGATDCFATSDGIRASLFDAEHIILEDTNIALCKVIDIDTANGRIPVAHLILKKDIDVIK